MCLVSESLNLWFITWLLGLNTHQIPKSQGNWHLLLDHGWNLPHKASSWTKKHLTQILHPEKQLPLRLRSSKFCNCLTLINTYSYLHASIFWRAIRSKLTHWRLWSLWAERKQWFAPILHISVSGLLDFIFLFYFF